MAQIRETIDTVRRCYNSRLKVLGILLNKYNQRFTLNREVLDMAGQIAAQLDTTVFEAKIRTSVSVAEAPAHGESVLSYAPDSKVAVYVIPTNEELVIARDTKALVESL